ncbi:MAG: Hpt domain-containing protein [Bacteroidales bacterium]|jgi:HPt (histidine-containing phosphotransfer) domain-containing protein|nr:Hpt domain-containing protein [Bacteroidales bacterium]
MDQKLYNLKKMDEIAQGDQGFIRDMLVTFVENVTAEIEGIRSLKTAEKWTVIAETAHKLASNFAYLGADGLHALAADIEKSVMNDHNLTGVADKTDKLCSEGILLVDQLKKDFDIVSAN